MRAPVLALVLAAACAGAWPSAAQDGSWTPRKLPWYALPARDLVGVGPVSLSMPAAAGACGAVSDRIEPFAAHGTVLLRVALRVESGAVSIAVRNEDGSQPLTAFKAIKAGDGVQSVYFRVDPGDGPRVIALCQAGPEGQDSRADVESLNVALAERLPADEAARASVGLLEPLRN